LVVDLLLPENAAIHQINFMNTELGRYLTPGLYQTELKRIDELSILSVVSVQPTHNGEKDHDLRMLQRPL